MALSGRTYANIGTYRAKAIHAVLSRGEHPLCGMGARIPEYRKTTSVENVDCQKCRRVIAVSVGELTMSKGRDSAMNKGQHDPDCRYPTFACICIRHGKRGAALNTQHTAPTFVRGDTPYWQAACSCTMSALAFTPCPTHRAAPKMLEGIDKILTLAFKHEVQYWLDAPGTDAEKLAQIVAICRDLRDMEG